MSAFYINYLKKHSISFPKYVIKEMRSNSKHRTQVKQVLCGTMKQEKINKHLKSQSNIASINYERRRIW